MEKWEKWEVTQHPPLENKVIAIKGDRPYHDNTLCQLYGDRVDNFGEPNANLIVTAVNACIEIANKYGSTPQQVAEQIEPIFELLEKAERVMRIVADDYKLLDNPISYKE